MNDSHLFRLSIIGFFLLASLTACEKLGLGGKAALPGSDKLSGGMTPVTPSMVNKLGNIIYNWKIGNLKDEKKIETDAEMKQPVDRVIANLKAAAHKDPKYGDVAKELDWRHETIKVEDPSLAKAFSGGGIAVYEGAFRHAKTEGVLAGILAHEMAHILARHEVKRVSALVAAGGVSAGTLAFTIANPEKMDPKVFGPVAGAMGLGYFFGVNQPWAREDEKEADCLGLSLAARAGYEPKVIEKFWDDASHDPKANGSFTFLKDHPTDKERYEYIKSTCLEEANKDYAKVAKEKRQSASAMLPTVSSGPPELGKTS
jgi:predicted Zn-dependent protease